MEGGRNQECSLLILDQNTAEIIDSFMTMVDVVEARIIGQFRLEQKRKQTKKMHVFYFITPQESSLNYLRRDFDEKLKEEEIKSQGSSQIPLYDIIHIIFCQPIDKFDLIELFKQQELASATASVRAINLNFQTIDNNIFSLNFKLEYKTLNLEGDEVQNKVLKDLAEQALGMYTLMGKAESVRIVSEKKGPALRFFQNFKDKTQKFINEVYEQKSDKNEYVPPIQVVILN